MSALAGGALKKLVSPLLVVVAFTLVPSLYFRPLWVKLFILTFLLYRVWLEIKDQPMPPKPLMLIVQVGAGVATWMHYNEFFGSEACGALLGLLLVLKTFELKQKRDCFFAAMLCLLVLMSHALVEQGLTMTLFCILGVVAVGAYLYALELEDWNWREAKSTMRSSLMLSLQTIPMLILLFLLFPRFSTGFGSQDAVQHKTGISDSLSPGSVSNLIPSDELMFRATFTEENVIPVNQLYWRGLVLDTSDGMNWTRSPGQDVRTVFASDTVGEVEVYLEPGSDRMLFTLENANDVLMVGDSMRRRVQRRESGVFELRSPLQVRERYSMLLAAEREPEPKPDSRWLQVKEPPSRKLAEWLKPLNGKPTMVVVRELLMFFRRAGFTYTLSPPPADSMDEFLFYTKTGFCEHYSGTLATLLRMLNVPARVVVGFQGGTPSVLGNYVTVRGHDAHSWVEYYDSEMARWRRLDPTVQVAPSRLEQGSDSYLRQHESLLPPWLPTQWVRGYFRTRAVIDQVDASWTSFLLGFDLSWQRSILAEFGMDEMIFPALPVFLVLSLILTMAVLYFLQAQRRDPMSWDERTYRKLIRLLGKRGVIKTAVDGPQTLLERVSVKRPDLVDITREILEPLVGFRYGGLAIPDQSRLQIQRALRRLRRMPLTEGK